MSNLTDRRPLPGSEQHDRDLHQLVEGEASRRLTERCPLPWSERHDRDVERANALIRREVVLTCSFDLNDKPPVLLIYPEPEAGVAPEDPDVLAKVRGEMAFAVNARFIARRQEHDHFHASDYLAGVVDGLGTSELNKPFYVLDADGGAIRELAIPPGVIVPIDDAGSGP